MSISSDFGSYAVSTLWVTDSKKRGMKLSIIWEVNSAEEALGKVLCDSYKGPDNDYMDEFGESVHLEAHTIKKIEGWDDV